MTDRAVSRRIAGHPIPQRQLLALRAADLWHFFVTQDLAFKAMCCYLVVEYIRPQQLIAPIEGAPLGQIVLGTALVAYLAAGAPGFGIKGAASWLFLLYTVVILASSVTAYDPSVSFDALRTWISWVGIYFLITNVVNSKPRFTFFILSWLLCNVYMAQGGTRQFMMRGFRFASWGLTGAPGWFENSGEFGVEMCMYVAISWHVYLVAKPHLTKWRKVLVLTMPATGLLCVIGSSSRGAVLGLTAIGLCALLRTKINVKTILGVAAVAALVWGILPPEQKARFSSAGEDESSIARKVFWLNGLDIAKSHPVLGIGYENWMVFYSKYYTASAISNKYHVHYAQVSHNIFLECLAELGGAGLVVYVLMIFATLLTNLQTRRLARAGPGPPDRFLIEMAYSLDEAMLCFLIAGFFVTILYYPFFWINLALTVSLNAVARRMAPNQAGRLARVVPTAIGRSGTAAGSVALRPARGARGAQGPRGGKGFRARPV